MHVGQGLTSERRLIASRHTVGDDIKDLQGNICLVANIKEYGTLCEPRNSFLVPVFVTDIISLLVGCFAIRWRHLHQPPYCEVHPARTELSCKGRPFLPRRSDPGSCHDNASCTCRARIQKSATEKRTLRVCAMGP